MTEQKNTSAYFTCLTDFFVGYLALLFKKHVADDGANDLVDFVRF